MLRATVIGMSIGTMLALLFSCGPSANQLAGEKAFYEAKVALSKAATSQPVFEMVSGDPTKPIVLENVSAIRVFQLPAQAAGDDLKQYEQKDYAAKWVGLIGTSISVAAPWLGAWGIVHEISGIAGPSTTYNQTVSGSGNTATTRTSSMAAGNITGNSNALSGMTEINDSYNPTTTTITTTTSTDDHTTTTTTTPAEP
jgi:hypothetical protein